MAYADVTINESDYAPIDESQQEQNDILEANGFNLAPKSEFDALLREIENPSSRKDSFAPIASAMERHPGLTREKRKQWQRSSGSEERNIFVNLMVNSICAS